MNLLKGLSSLFWKSLQDAHFIRIQQPNRLGSNGVLSAIFPLIDSIHDIWLFRNSQRHSADNIICESELSRKTVEAIADLYELWDQVLPPDCCLFRSSLDDHLKESQSSLRAWLSNHSTHLYQSFHCMEKLQAHNTHSLSFYFS